TVTGPPGPDCGPVAEAAIWVLPTPRPSSKSVPGVVTLTDPPAPNPLAFVEIEPPLPITKLPAVTDTRPAFPVLPSLAWELMPVGKFGSARVPPIDSPPAPPTVPLPPLPAPAARPEIWPLLTIDRLPALTVTLPALPALSGSAPDEMPV